MEKIINTIRIFLPLIIFTFLSSCDDISLSERMFKLTSYENISASFPVWSPDGSFIVFSGHGSSEGPNGLWTIDIHGGNLTLLLESNEIGPGTHLYPYDYSDDGYLLFSEDSSILASNIYYLPSDGGYPVFIFQGAHPTIKGNLDGIYNIAYYYQPQFKGTNGIYITDIHGSDPQLVIAGDFIYGPHWSPDGNKLTYYKDFGSDGEMLWKLCVYDFTIQKEEVLTTLYYWGGTCPRWSPDGQWIAFLNLCEETSEGEVFIIPSEGGDPIRLTEFPYGPMLMAPSACSIFWSPDNKWISFDLCYIELWKVSVE